MGDIISMVDPVRARAERKAHTRLMMEENRRTKRDRKNLKLNIKLDKIEGAEFVRQTTPEIKTLDLIAVRQKTLAQLEAATDRELISLRRRLVTAEKLVGTRTRERDSAHNAHKVKVQALASSRSTFRKQIAEKEVAISLLLKRLERFENRSNKMAEIRTKMDRAKMDQAQEIHIPGFCT